MGTSWRVTWAAPGADRAGLDAAVAEELATIIAQMSQWEPQSALSRFNRAPAGSWHNLDWQFFRVLEAALGVARDSGGAFDPGLGALVDAWGFGPSPATGGAPTAARVETLRSACGAWRGIETDQGARRALQPGGVALDFSGIAKGFAVDRLAERLRQAGIVHFLAEIGGELVGAGIQPDGQPWWVDVERPPGARLAPLRIALHGLAVATSGDYRRWFAADGVRQAHSLDPRTGAPARHGVASVTVLHDSCMLADALATAITVLGPAEGMAFAAARALAAYMIVRDGDGWRELLSPALAAMLD